MFTGTYQLAQAVSYLAAMVDTDGKLRIEYVKDESNSLKLKIPSRHISRTAYRCFLRYKPNTFVISGLTHYTRECANGQRTVGCCSQGGSAKLKTANGERQGHSPKSSTPNGER